MSYGEPKPVGNLNASAINYTNQYQWTPGKTVKKTTETFEYDAEGRVTKKTVVTEETTEHGHYPQTYPYWYTNVLGSSVNF